MSRHQSPTRRQAADLLAELRVLGSEANRAGMARYGITVERAFGVSVHTLRTLARPKAMEWARRDEPWVKRAGFALMAGLAVHDKAATDQALMKLLPLIEQAAGDDRNFVRKAVNWALCNVGKRNLALHNAAMACARRILVAADTRAGGLRSGDAGARSARWVATDAIRELDAEKLHARLAGRRGRSAVNKMEPAR